MTARTDTWRTTSGGRIERDRILRFRFDGRSLTGVHGDTLASALLANGVHLVGRSFKYHRPRGIVAAGVEEPNALVRVQRDAARCTPNLRATQVELYDGLQAVSQNRWPSLQVDVGALGGLLARFLPAGFYYKTFMWPRRAWTACYEPLIRAAAGLGRAPEHSDPDRYAQRYAHCDVLVVGAGPSGLAAATAAAQRGARVIVCDEQAEFGGWLLSDPQASIDGRPALEWLTETLRALHGNPRVTLLSRTSAFGCFPHNWIALNERLTDHLAAPDPQRARERLWQVRTRQLVIAAGAIERPLVFPGNDRPGIMLAGAARTYLHRYGVLPGKRAVLVTACDEAYRSAFELQAAGVTVVLIADVRAAISEALQREAQRCAIPVITQATVLGTHGRSRVRALDIARLDGERRPLPGARREACDLVLMSGGYTPSVHLHSQSRGGLTWYEPLQCFVPLPSDYPAMRSAGTCRGLWDLAAIITDGRAAGADAAQAAGHGAGSGAAPAPLPRSGDGAYAGALPQPVHGGHGKAFVDWQNDVTAADLALAAREGFRSIEHVKRYTTTGMATDQGKTSNLNALGIVAQQIAQPIAEVGLTTFRMPYTPVSFASFAGYARGSLFEPVRTTPLHPWAEHAGAVFEDVGAWKRARYLPRADEDMAASVERECLAVRRGCALFDASTLGKIEVVGPDAAAFLDRLYVNSFSTLAVGRCRYGLLLRDDGFIFDDGVIARLAEDRFHVTTTTGGAARVLALLEDYLQTQWNELQLWLTSTTEQWAVLALQGPRSRQVLAGLIEGVDLSPAALPHMSVAHGRICGIPMRLFRVSFTGELGFEINVPPEQARAAWEAILQAGQPHGIDVYGTESMHVLRAEKGYIIVGQDADGTTTPQDAGLGWLIGKNKSDFVGKRSLQRPAMLNSNRRQLVGLLTLDPTQVLEEGSQVLQQSRSRLRPLGHVTSSYRSPTLDRSIALAMIAGGRERHGHTVYVPTLDGELAAQVVGPVFYDSAGERLNA
ncbi:MAG TPA: sarcosine oxidase subunit alpha family protein [Steroidobacteraceae bacterium]